MSDLANYVARVSRQARVASRQLATATGQQKNDWIRRTAEALRDQASSLIEANRKDLEAAPGYGLTPAAIDRLKLTPDGIDKIASAMEEVIALPDPVGEVLDSNVRPNGLLVTRVRVPLGVVFFIYESRPNVTIDAAGLCVKSGNAVILRGGKEAFHSNQALYRILAESLEQAGLPRHAVQLVETTDREAVKLFLKQKENIDVAIPRGGKSLIETVAAEATMPVIKHFDGICHVFVDASADLDMALRILVDGKCRRPGVCNAVECVLVHREIAAQFLPMMGERLATEGVEIRGCDQTREYLPSAKLATEQDYRTEYLALILSSRVVENLDQAIEHITEYGSHHTETIVTNHHPSAMKFVNSVDSSGVFINASTRFNDGGELGLGAEIGISTDKFHARGPCGLKELTSYKYVAFGSGQVRG
jgi:glutamate-5-semialdehyde dehydrogenase